MIYSYFRQTVLSIYVLVVGLIGSRHIYQSWRDVPNNVNFQVIQKSQDKALGLTILLILMFCVGLFILLYLLSIPEKRLRERQEETWRKNHIHDWNGCVCTDPKCRANRHKLDDNCTCINCGTALHDTVPHQWDFGSTRVTDEICKRCSQTVGSSSYYAG